MTNSPSSPEHTLESVADTTTAFGDALTTIDILSSSGHLLFTVVTSMR